MHEATVERAILERYRDKCAMAGGPREGYVLRRQAIALGAPQASPETLDGALAALVERGLLAANDRRDLYFLTAAGVGEVGALQGS
jgi:hypothetical protein